MQIRNEGHDQKEAVAPECFQGNGKATNLCRNSYVPLKNKGFFNLTFLARVILTPFSSQRIGEQTTK